MQISTAGRLGRHSFVNQFWLFDWTLSFGSDVCFWLLD